MPYFGSSPRNTNTRSVIDHQSYLGSQADTSTNSGYYTFYCNYTIGNVSVILRGVHMADSDYTATNGTDIRIATSSFTLNNDDVIEIIGHTVPSSQILERSDVNITGGAISNAVLNNTNTYNFLDNSISGDKIDGGTISDSVLKLKSTGDSIVASDGTTGILSESAGAVTLTADEMNVGSNALVVNSNGNVGIGTSPSELLDVYGAINVRSGFNVQWGSSDNYIAANSSVMLFGVNASERMRIDSSGNVGIGTSSPNYLLEVKSAGTSIIAITAASTSYDSEIHFIHGTTVDGGITYDHNGSFSAEAMKFRTGNNTTNMTLTGTGNLTITGSYSPFTATHIASIQNPENYKYGEIIEIESIVSNGFNIHYNARLANSDPRKILGVFREIIQDLDDNQNIIHNSLVNVLGDGHILVNAENGNIKIGDAITLSSTAGVGKKATEPCYVIGIAQEDFIFEIESESVLIPVQYGLQYFIPENFIESQQSQIDALTARIEALEAGN